LSADIGEGVRVSWAPHPASDTATLFIPHNVTDEPKFRLERRTAGEGVDWVEVEELSGDLVLQLSYPRRIQEYADEVLRDVYALEVRKFAVDRGQLLLLGKGFRNVVFLVETERGRAALKVRRDDAPSTSVGREAVVHAAANRAGVGPRLLGSGEHSLLMEVVVGTPLHRWLPEASGEEVRTTIGKALMQCRGLDLAGIDHGELTRAHKHVLVTEELEVKIIDFGAARFTPRPGNVTSFLRYLYSREVKPLLAEKLGDREVDLQLLREYKRTLSEEAFRAVLRSIGLA
jgi:putative serine/threonine protein kinase